MTRTRKGNLLTDQPSACRAKLPAQEITLLQFTRMIYRIGPATPIPDQNLKTEMIIEARYHRTVRILAFDPAPAYENLLDCINPFARHSYLPIDRIFPDKKNLNGIPVCACGCDTILKGRRKRWAGESCSLYASLVHSILYGSTSIIYDYLRFYYGEVCNKCSHYHKSLQVDHIIPVKHGGGGGWLSNYQLLCPECHKEKTAQDFGHVRTKRLLVVESELNMNTGIYRVKMVEEPLDDRIKEL